jgi:type IV pilus assembly protein PilB
LSVDKVLSQQDREQAISEDVSVSEAITSEYDISEDSEMNSTETENSSVELQERNSEQEKTQRILAGRLGLPFVLLHDHQFDETVLAQIPAEFARKHNVIPIQLSSKRLLVAMADPMASDLYQSLSFICDLTIDIAVATLDDVRWGVRQFYGQLDDEIALESLSSNGDSHEGTQELERLSAEQPIVRLVKNIVRDAIERKASDIHIRPRLKNVELIYRLDGVLTTIRYFNKSLLPAVVSRIKIIGGMDIAERRMPQDGRSCVRTTDNAVDLRISVMPTVEGESVVIRLLNAQAGLKTISGLGFSHHDEEVFIDLLNKSNGIFLVTGPTGSGKSTTLYSALGEVQKQNVNIITVEDPVEYHLDGVQQIQINHATGYTFARALRNILRHDPDVILVGEIRDQETGKVAVESALTGHLVFSTLHTNDAAGAISRLLEMEIEPYLINSCLLGVLAQRLVRKNCQNCLEIEPVNRLVRRALNISLDEVFYHGAGCDQCNQSGISGRRAVYELLRVTDELKEIIRPEVSTDDIRKSALKFGMVPLTENALSRARAKDISLAEVYRIRLE